MKAKDIILKNLNEIRNSIAIDSNVTAAVKPYVTDSVNVASLRMAYKSVEGKRTAVKKIASPNDFKSITSGLLKLVNEKEKEKADPFTEWLKDADARAALVEASKTMKAADLRSYLIESGMPVKAAHLKETLAQLSSLDPAKDTEGQKPHSSSGDSIQNFANNFRRNEESGNDTE